VPPEVAEVQAVERAEAEARAAEERARKEAQLALMRRQQAEQQALQVGPVLDAYISLQVQAVL
jgi:hypothetical protein